VASFLEKRGRVILCALAVSCKRADPGPACPAEAFVEGLHAAAFHFQHGPAAVARQRLAHARSIAPTPLDETSEKILGQLDEISRRIEDDPSWAQRETENIRLELGDWRCLAEDAHRRFHAKLPSLR
jgi:hypothetical protein